MINIEMITPGFDSGIGPALRVKGTFAVFSVCDACWREPAHRSMPLTGHFFYREQEAEAYARAGSSNLG